MNWDRVSELHESCLELPSHKWKEWIDKHCTHDDKNQGVDTMVLKLLKNSSKADAFFSSLHKNIDEDLGDESEEILLQPGAKFGKFRVTKEIGHGGMARVYLCSRDDGQFEQQVAVKIMKVKGNVEFLKDKFRQEQQILAGINHPNIAQLYDGGITPEGYPYIVMEYVEGQAIDEYCKEKKPGLHEMIRLFMQVCNAMQYAHNKLIVHHDIKPANILVNKEGSIKLLDFGIAQVIFNQEKGTYKADSFTGTLKYAAPEQFSSAPPSVESDIFKIGLVFYVLLTNKHFDYTKVEEGRLESEVRDAIQKVSLRSGTIRGLKEKIIREDLTAILSKCLANEPEQRFLSASELLHDLQNMLSMHPLHSRQPSMSYSLTKRYLRNKKKVWLVTFFNVALLIALVFWISQFIQTIKEKERAEYLLAFVFDIFESADPELRQGATVTVVELLENSIEKIDNIENRPEFQSELYHSTGMILTRLGEWKRGGELYYKALDLHHGFPDSRALQISRAHLYRDIAAYHRNLAESAVADSLIILAIGLYSKNLSQVDPKEIASAWNIKAHIARIDARAEQGLEYAEKSLEILRLASHTPSWELVSAKANKAAAFKDLSRFEESLQVSREAIEIMDLLGDEINSTRVMLVENYAIALGQTGKTEEAIEVQQELLDMNRRLYGEESPTYLITLFNMAGNYYRLGEYPVSDSINLMLLDVYMEKFGPANNYTLSVMYNLSNSFYSQRNFEKALDFQYRVLEGDRVNFGDKHPFVAGGYYSLGLTYMELEEFEKSRENLFKSLDLYKESFGEKHHQVARVYGRIAELYCRLDDAANCSRHFDRAYEIAMDVIGEEHPITKAIINRMEFYEKLLSAI